MEATVKMELKEKLVDLRKRKGLSQAELAEAIKVSRQTISRWEVGTAIPSADNLMWLSRFYEVSLDELMDITADGGQETNEEKQPAGNRRSSMVLIVIACIWLCVLILGILRHAILAAGLFIIGTAILLITFLLLSKVVSYIWRELYNDKI